MTLWNRGTRSAGAGLLLCLAAGCGVSMPVSSIAGATVGSIAFGTAQVHHKLYDPRTTFGPQDTIAYVAHLNTRRTIKPHTDIHEYYVRVRSDGSEEPTFNDTFDLKVPVHRFITLNSFPISQLYRVGFHRGDTYRVRLVQGGERLAEGTFSLR